MYWCEQNTKHIIRDLSHVTCRIYGSVTASLWVATTLHWHLICSKNPTRTREYTYDVSIRKEEDMAQSLPNPHLEHLKKDNLYHLGFSTDDDLKTLFGDVKFVCMGGSATRMEELARMLCDELSDIVPVKSKPENICKTDRFVMYKVGPVLAANHHMGMPSLSIILHELIKLLYYAGCEAPLFIRIGTSGGIGVPPGTLVIADKAYDEHLKSQHQDVVLGKVRVTDATFDQKVAEEILSLHTETSYDAIIGSTLGTQDFYEGQGRLDGAICEYTEEDKRAYLLELQKLEIKNIEMEATKIASLCQRTNRQAAMVCVTLVDRLAGDQVDLPKETYAEYQLRPLTLMIKFIKHRLTQSRDATRKRTQTLDTNVSDSSKVKKTV